MFAVRALSRVLFALSVYVCIPTILVVLTADVVLRYGFNSPLRWAQELASLLLFLSLVLALPESWLKNIHVRADFLKALISPGLSEVLSRLAWALVLGFSVIIVVQCWRDAQFMILIRESSSELHVPLVWLRAALALAAALSGLIALTRLFSLRRITRVNEGKSL